MNHQEKFLAEKTNLPPNGWLDGKIFQIRVLKILLPIPKLKDVELLHLNFRPPLPQNV